MRSETSRTNIVLDKKFAQEKTKKQRDKQLSTSKYVAMFANEVHNSEQKEFMSLARHLPDCAQTFASQASSVLTDICNKLAQLF